MNKSFAISLSFLVVCLSGCVGGDDFSDLQSYMDDVRARPQGAIEPLPKFQPYEAFTYGASALRSPFQPPVKIDLASQQKGSKDVKPDDTRVKQFLEGFNIEAFEMVGTLENNGGVFGLVRGAGGFTGSKLAITWGEIMEKFFPSMSPRSKLLK
ncbi:hypothetical protein OH686_10035 [Pseudomonas sp. SO81]|nr:hypothetical protein OH686_10035 [Pseudomonas sp. SO81]